MTRLPEKRIDIALVKEFYSNLYDPKDRSLKFCRVRGQVVRFEAKMINDFLDTPVILVDGEEYPAYSQYLHTPPDHDAILSTLCTSGGAFCAKYGWCPLKAAAEGPDDTRSDMECPFVF